MVKWGRLTALIIIIVVVFGLIGTTGTRLARHIPLGLDLQGGFDVLYQIGNPNQHVTANDVRATVATISHRVNSLGVASPVIQVENGTRVNVALAGTFNQTSVRQLLSKPANLEFKSMSGKLLATGADLVSNAHYTPDPTTQAPIVAIQFKNPGLLQAISEKYLKKPMAIWFDGKMLEAPVIQNVFTNGQATITGFASVKAAQQFASLLNAGALPLPLHVLSSMSVGPTLGQAALHTTLTAALFAVIAIFAFMLLVYRLPGLIAIFALCAYSYVLVAVFAGFPVTLTLTGLAALVLGVGMAVDANIITYERIKDELRRGRSLQSAVVSGQRKALRTILDSNTTTLIAGIVMYIYGSGDVQGFAVALIASIIISLLTAVFLSRTMLMLLTKSNLVRDPRWFGLAKGKEVEAK